jgi:thymidylate synthase (FAD)
MSSQDSTSEFAVKVVSVTSPVGDVEFLDSEQIIAYCARVSNPSNQENTASMPKLLKYLQDHNHWSPFEMAHAVLEIDTSRGISPQILRHRSFSFQEHSQRYQALDESGIVIYAARRQDLTNKQNSIDDLPDPIKKEWKERQSMNWKQSFENYKWALDNGIAKECARMVLPLGTKTRMYMAGSIRSWMHYISVRTDPSTQKEHRDIAVACKKVLAEHFNSLFGEHDV